MDPIGMATVMLTDTVLKSPHHFLAYRLYESSKDSLVSPMIRGLLGNSPGAVCSADKLRITYGRNNVSVRRRDDFLGMDNSLIMYENDTNHEMDNKKHPITSRR
jgi:hypothetical protein